MPSNQVGDINKDQLPDASALLAPGNKEGEVRMVRSGAVVEAHQWDSAAQQWQKIGEVVDAVGQGRKQLHDGKEYDYVFDINIDDGAPNLKLPYNVTGTVHKHAYFRKPIHRCHELHPPQRAAGELHRPGG